MAKMYWTVSRLDKALAKLVAGTLKGVKLTVNGEKTFDLGDMTSQGILFAALYGVKQIEADSVAGKGEKAEYTIQERYTLMTEKFEEVLCNDKCEILRTDKGFTLRDPDKVVGIDPLSRERRKLQKMEEEVANQIDVMVESGVKKAMAKDIADKIWGERIEASKAKIKELEAK